MTSFVRAIGFKRSNSMIAQIKGAKDKVYHIVARIMILAMVVIICTATTVAAANSIVVSYVYCDDEMTRVVSFSTDVDDILNKANITLDENDVVDLSSYTDAEDEGVIYVYRACDVTVTDGEKQYSVNIAGTVEQAVIKAGVKLHEGDEFNYDNDLYVFDGMKIEVRRVFGVKVVADSKTIKCKVTEGATVAEVLDKAGVELNENDTVSKKLTKTVSEGDKIVVRRVTYSTHTETEKLPFKTVTKKDKSMYKDQSKVTQQGKDGKQKVTYEDKYIDGELVKSTVKSTKVKTKATDKIVVVGTKSRPVVSVSGKRTISELTPPSSLTLDENGRPTSYKKLITGKATAYYSGTTCSTGVHVKPGYIAVNPKQIPYGTKMYIVSSDGKYVYGYAIAADTGGFARKGTAVADLFMWSEADCWQFGRRNVDIYILN